MQARSLSFAALASSLLVFAAQPAPTTTKYRIERVYEQDVDATAVGGPKQHNSFVSTSFVSLMLTDSAAGRTAHLIVDSVTVGDSTPPAVKVVLDSLKGRAFHAYLEDGKVASVKPMIAGQETQQATDLFAQLVPRIRAGTKAGAGWTDTTDVTNDIAGGSMKVRTVTNFKAIGSEKRDGVNALKVEAASSSALNGKQGEASIEGTGTGTATYYVGPDGRLVASTSATNQTLAVTVPQAPEPIPLTLTVKVTVGQVK